MAEVRLCLFGTPRLMHDGGAIKLDSWKALALLAYLALNGQVCSREALATLFWPEQDETRARSSLRRALWTLRQALPADALDGDRQTVSLRSSALAVDVLHFQSLVAAARAGKDEPDTAIPQLQAASALYSADFLAGFTLRDAPAFDEWQFFVGEQLRQSAADSFEQLIHWYRDRQEYGSAIEYARRWLALDALHEPAHRCLMQLYAWSGQQSAALRQYETCRRLLEEELGATPDAETSELYVRIRTDPIAPPANTVTTLAHTLTAQAPPRHRLPRFLTPLLGRDHELADLDQLIFARGERLITIIGLGGIGKTRMAVAFAEGLLRGSRLRDGLCFITLAAVAHVEAIVPALVNALGLAAVQASADAQRRRILDFLASKQMLLILDNFEHLLPGRSLLVDILEAAPDVHILVTSRERLNLRNEQLYPIGGLACPTTSPTTSPNARPNASIVKATPALNLFLQTARRVDPDYAPNEAEQEHLVRICHLVSGMPLALELAAGWVHLLKPSAISEALQTNLDLLASNLHDLPLRHRSVRAAFDVTWMLLAKDELHLFAKLSIFRGGFTREAAHQVAGANLVQLGALADKSLIEYRRGTDRYEMHELLRQYGAEKLATIGRYEETTERLLHYCILIAERAEPHLRGAGRAEWMAALASDHYNLRAAFEWACLSAQINVALRLAGALLPFWLAHGAWTEGAQSLSRALALSNAQDASHVDIRAVAKVFYGVGLFAWHQSDYRAAKSHAVESFTRFQQLADEYGSAQALHLLALTARAQRDFAQATDHFTAGLALARRCGDQLLMANILSDMGAVAWRQNAFIRARELYEESLAYYQAEDDAQGVAISFFELGLVACWQGELERARTFGERSLAGFRQLADPFYISQVFGLLALVSLYQNELDEAQSLLEKTLACYRKLNAQRSIALALLRLGHVKRQQNDMQEAKQLYGEATAMLRRIGDPLNLIHALEAWFYVAVCDHEFEKAARLGGTVDGWRIKLGTPRPPVDVPEYNHHITLIHTAIGESRCKRAWAQGREQSLDQAFDDLGELDSCP